MAFPEEPIAVADGSLILTAVRRGVRTQVTHDGKVAIIAETDGGPNGEVVGPDGAIYVTNNGGLTWLDRGDLNIPGPIPADHVGSSIQRVEVKTGAVITLYKSRNGKPLIAPNEIVFDITGGMWFTDLGSTTPDRSKFGALYYAQTDDSGNVRGRGNLISPNGVGLSPDETVICMADTLLKRLWAFDIVVPVQLKRRERGAPGRDISNLQGYQKLDGLAVEAGGKVCVVTLVNGGVTVFELEGSIEHFPFPDFAITDICFGGEDMRDARITCSVTGTLYKCRWPRPGLKLNFNS